MPPKALDGNMGAPAQSEGAPSQNESTPPEQRVPDRIKKVGAGPEVGAAGEYKPARYETRERTVPLINGRTDVVPPSVREDR